MCSSPGSIPMSWKNPHTLAWFSGKKNLYFWKKHVNHVMKSWKIMEHPVELVIISPMVGDIAKSSKSSELCQELLQAAEWLRTAWGTWVQKIGQRCIFVIHAVRSCNCAFLWMRVVCGAKMFVNHSLSSNYGWCEIHTNIYSIIQ
jgi:hypothetical protein